MLDAHIFFIICRDFLIILEREKHENCEKNMKYVFYPMDSY